MGAFLLAMTLLATADVPVDETPSDSAPAETTPESAPPVAPPSDKPQLVVLELDAIEVDEKQVEIITGRIADVLGRESSFTTLTSTDLRQLMDVAAERQSLGCDTEACVAELAAAYGARYVVYGRVAKVADLVLMQLSLFDADAAKPISRREIEGATVRDLLDATAGAAKDLVLPLTGGAPAPTPESGFTPGPLFWVGGGLGLVGVAGGAGLGGYALYLLSVVQSTGGTVAPNARVEARDRLPFVGLGAGAAGLLGVVGFGVLAADFFLE